MPVEDLSVLSFLSAYPSPACVVSVETYAVFFALHYTC